MTDVSDHQVRVELDGAPTAAGEPGRPPRRTTTWLAVAVVGLVAALLFGVALRGGHEGDDAGSAAVPTTILPTTSVSGDEPASADLELVVQEATGPEHPVDWLVRADVGFLGLVSPADVDGAPQVVRSVDGVAWSSVDVAGPFASDILLRKVDYSHLVAADDEFAMLRSTLIATEDGGSFLELDRFVSADGATWSIDPQVGTRRLSRQSWITHHDAERLLVAELRSDPNPALVELVEQTLLAPTDRLPCSAAPVPDGVVVQWCDGESQQFRAEDFVDPDTVTDVGRCADHVGEEWQRGYTVSIISTDGLPETEVDIAPGLTAIVPATDALFGFDFGARFAFDVSSCDPWLDLAAPVPAAVVRHDFDGSVTRFDVPMTTFGAPPQLFAFEGSVAFWDGRVLRILDPGTMALIDRVEVTDGGELGWRAALHAESSTFAIVQGAELFLADLDGGSWRRVELPVRRYDGGVVYLDDAAAYLLSGFDLFRVDLMIDE